MSKWSKAISVTAVLLVLLGVFSTPTLAGGGKATNMVLVDARFVSGKGAVFTFRVNGKVSNIGNASFNEFHNVGCTQIDAETVKCTVPKNAGGQNGTLYVGDFAFWVSVPVYVAEYCYTVYDFDFDDVWGPIGVYCQGYSGELGQWIEFYNPLWENTYIYDFLFEGFECYANGPGYYYTEDGCSL